MVWKSGKGFRLLAMVLVGASSSPGTAPAQADDDFVSRYREAIPEGRGDSFIDDLWSRSSDALSDMLRGLDRTHREADTLMVRWICRALGRISSKSPDVRESLTDQLAAYSYSPTLHGDALRSLVPILGLRTEWGDSMAAQDLRCILLDERGPSSSLTLETASYLLAAQDPYAVAFLQRVVHNPEEEPHQRIDAAGHLADHGHSDGFELALKMIGREIEVPAEDPTLCGYDLIARLAPCDPRAEKVLLESLHTGDPLADRIVLMALGDLPNPAATRVIREFLQAEMSGQDAEGDYESLVIAIDALRSHGTPEAEVEKYVRFVETAFSQRPPSDEGKPRPGLRDASQEREMGRHNKSLLRRPPKPHARASTSRATDSDASRGMTTWRRLLIAFGVLLGASAIWLLRRRLRSTMSRER